MQNDIFLIKSFISTCTSGGGVILGLNILTSDNVSFLKGVRKIEKEYKNWRKSYKDRCRRVEFTVTSPKKNHIPIEEIIDKFYEKYIVDSNSSEQIAFKVKFLNEISQVIKKKNYNK